MSIRMDYFESAALSSSALSTAALKAFMMAPLKPPFSRAWRPQIVNPPGEATESLTCKCVSGESEHFYTFNSF